MKNLISPTRRRTTAIVCSLALLGALVTATRADEPHGNAECTYDAHAWRTGPPLWHDVSVQAEIAAPTRVAADAAGSGRRRSVPPPKAAAPKSKNFIDDEIFGKMTRDGIAWTTPASDEEFLRRVTLDLTGEIPDAATVKSFLADASPDKRDTLVDKLLTTDAFVDRWTMWFGDHLQNVAFAQTGVEFSQGRNAYYRYLYNSIRDGKPYDQMVREVIAATGSSYLKGENNFFVRQVQNNGPIQDTYDNLSAFSGARFLGLPLQCLSCHHGLGHLEQVNSSLSKRFRNDFWQNAAFFAQIQVRRENLLGGQGVETIVSDNTTGKYQLNTTSGNKTPRQPVDGKNFVDPAFFLGGEGPQPGEPRRVAYARILTAHPQFARATVNYLWKEIFGLGIVEPTDSFDLLRQDPASLPQGAPLQPTHPALITKLAESFSSGGYSLRALLRLMVTSNAYQLSTRYNTGTWNESWVPYFPRHFARRLTAEELVDGIARATAVGVSLQVSDYTGPVKKAMQLPDTIEQRGGDVGRFMDDFGRGNRDDEGRSYDGSIVQALALMNNPIVTTRVKNATKGSRVQSVLKATKDPSAIVEELYLNTLSRYPTAAERQAGVAWLQGGDLTRRTEDLQFALLNKLEFLFN